MYRRPPGVAARLRHWMISYAGRSGGNFLPDGAPRVSIPGMRRAGVVVALSVLHAPFDEIAPRPRSIVAGPRALRHWRSILRRGNAPNAGAALSLALATLVAKQPPNRGCLRAVGGALAARYGERDATAICVGNAERVLRTGWRVALPV
jgi:hypothetical protein